jgi:hypothetical protein
MKPAPKQLIVRHQDITLLKLGIGIVREEYQLFNNKNINHF